MNLLKYPADANLDNPRWQPIKVTCYPVEPIVMPDNGIPLDGPLAWGAWQLYQDAGQPSGVLEPATVHLEPWALDFDLPVARWSCPLPEGDEVSQRLLTSNGEVWGWCCSCVQGEWALHDVVNVRKRPAVDEMITFSDSPSFNPSLGTTKSYDLAFPSRVAAGARLWWYVLGDPEALPRLLARVPTLGKKRNQGNGRLLERDNGLPRWDVEVLPEDVKSWWCRKDGQWMRDMPVTMTGGYGVKMAVRAPHWHRSRFVTMGARHV